MKKAVTGEYAGIRRITRLYPAGDPKIYPPTYEGGEYATETRKVKNERGEIQELDTVLLDSVQSQANRMELALLAAYRAGKVKFPMLQVDFASGEEDPTVAEIGLITALELPHRMTDALLRDSELNGVAFRRSSVGAKLDSAKSSNATPVFELCPLALVMGFWDSTGPRGGLGAKVQRALVSEVVGYDIANGVRPASRIDPVVHEGVDIFAKRAAAGRPMRSRRCATRRAILSSMGRRGRPPRSIWGTSLPR
jgi:CRISPR-associated protein Csb1